MSGGLFVGRPINVRLYRRLVLKRDRQTRPARWIIDLDKNPDDIHEVMRQRSGNRSIAMPQAFREVLGRHTDNR